MVCFFITLTIVNKINPEVKMKICGSIYDHSIKKEDIRKGLLLLDLNFSCYQGISNGPGIVSFHDQESGKYKIFFFERGIEAGPFQYDYWFGDIINEENVVAYFEDRLSYLKRVVNGKKKELAIAEKELENYEKTIQAIPELIKKYSE